MAVEGIESCGSRAQEFNSSSSSSPKKNRQHRQKLEVFNEVLNRLNDMQHEETKLVDFEDQLWSHFNRLPPRYALDVNVERAEDVLTHKRLLHLAEDPANRPAFEVRLVQVPLIPTGVATDFNHLDSSTKEDAQSYSNNSSRNGLHPPPTFGSSQNLEALALQATGHHTENGDSISLPPRPMHEITFSTVDRPKLLSQLTTIVSEAGLNIQEAHAFSTADGFSLDVFVVDGWPHEETAQLKSTLEKEILKAKSHSGSIEDVDTEELLRQMALVKFAIHPSTQFKSWDDEAMWDQIIKDMREKNGRNPTLITVLETVIYCHDSYISNPSMSSLFAKLVFGKEDMGFDIECIEKMLGCRGKQMTGGKRKKEISENNSASVSTATDNCSFDFSITELWMLLEKLKRAVSANKIGYETCRVEKDVAGEAIKKLESAYQLAESSILFALRTQGEAGAAKREVEEVAGTLSYLNSIDKITAEEMAVAAHILKNDRSAARAFLQVLLKDAKVEHIKKMINKWNPPQRFA